VEIEAAVRRMLLADLTVNGYVAGKVFKFRLEEQPSGGRAVVVRRIGGWTAPGTGSQEYPLVEVQCWADHSRDAEGLMVKADAEENAWALYRAVMPLMHGVRNQWWGAMGSNPGLLIVGSYRSGEPILFQGKLVGSSPGRGGTHDRGEAMYVSATFAVQTVHTKAA